MSKDYHNRLQELFLRVRGLEQDEQQKFLDEACINEPAELRRELEAMLALDEKPEGPLGEAWAGTESAHTPSQSETERASLAPQITGEHPRRIGPYKILQVLGEGGMGVVYLAEQEQPRRKVAVKIIKWGMDTKRVVARFEAERQALALMDHPNVAKVFDAGATEQGRPYFVMEYVKGVPITEHCDRQRLTISERLELLTQACAGVQHAHQKAIIHRDIKPSNILVALQDDRAVPKIIDFGVAKATAQRLTEQTLFTEIGQIIGTPEYMSPEQAEMTSQDIDTRTDVYSLGVLLYELISGTLPFESRELRRAGYDEIRRKVREEEPPRPSTRMSTPGEQSAKAAQNRRSDPGSLVRQLRRDLDWIVMKALEKDRTRRYGSPSELAADIARHLRHEPVVAGPPSATYRAGKFVRRHRLGVAATSVLLLGLAAGVVGSAVGLVRARRAAETSELVSEFLADTLGRVDPARLGRTLRQNLEDRAEESARRRGLSEAEIAAALDEFDSAMTGINTTDVGLQLMDEEILTRTGARIENTFEDKPLVAARLEHTLGATYVQLGMYGAAEPHASRALELRERELGRRNPDTLDSMSRLARVYLRQESFDDAESLYLETLEARRRVLGDDHPDTLNSGSNLASLYFEQGRYDEAERLYLETLPDQRQLLGDDHPDTLSSKTNLANVYFHQERYDDAERLYLETKEAWRRVLGDDDPDTVANLASLYLDQKRYDEAEPLFLEVLEARRRTLGDNHPDTLDTAYHLAMVYENQGRFDEAEPLHLETFRLNKLELGENHSLTLDSQNNLAWFWLTREPVELRKPDDALTLALDLAEKTEYQDPNVLDTLSLAYDLTGDTAKAIETQRAAVALLPEDSPDRAFYEETLAGYEAVLESNQ